MPYINSVRRQRFNPIIDALLEQVEFDNDLSYCIFQLMDKYCYERNYSNLVSVTGVVRLTLDEYIRRIVRPYQVEQIRHNGDLWDNSRDCR